MILAFLQRENSDNIAAFSSFCKPSSWLAEVKRYFTVGSRGLEPLTPSV